MAQSLKAIWAQIMKRRFLKTGLPFIVLVAGGSFFLKEFTGIRYQFRQGMKMSKEEAEKLGIKFVSLEEVVKEMEQMDVDNWENIRGPRPWEDSKSMQNEQRESLKKKNLVDNR
ncbi:unnamed protein product [Candidula unifasciata]|uniref:Cytochrome c oxidase assembly protein COX16 homolog, mitochondrial n=1 Tax=Candidula unifasciata TaxID=100452 RepID=A0A8S3ZSE7_9EUPU|nr:unnamed protein product [Candidula unifasciata]